MLSVTPLGGVASVKCWWWQHLCCGDIGPQQVIRVNRETVKQRDIHQKFWERNKVTAEMLQYFQLILWTSRANGLYYVLCMHWIALQLYNCGVEADGDVSCQSWVMRRWSSNNQIIAAARSSAQRWELERSSHTSAVAGAVQLETNLREVRSFTIMEKPPTKAFSLLKTPTSTFT